MSHAKLGTPAGVDLATGDDRLKIEFRWHQDRFVHRILVDGVEVGHTVDGDGEMDWPPSPPIQQLSLESIGNAPVILGVGGAGRGHWSISVERIALDRNSDEYPSDKASGSHSIKFDLACRSKDAAVSLGSSYRLSRNVQLIAIDGSIEESEAEILRVVPSALESGTCRWSYELKLA